MKNYRFRALLATLLLLALIYPFVVHFKLPGLAMFLNALTTLILLSSIHAVSENRRQLVLAVTIVVPAIALGWVDQFSQIESLRLFTLILQVLAYGLVACLILGYALRGGRVDTEKIAAAVSVYLFMGIIWQDLYSLTEMLIPGSFNTALLTHSQMLYFSFITLSTLGYGDITPVNGPAQALAYLEALLGQLYLTILVARLVGLHIAYTGPDCSEDG